MENKITRKLLCIGAVELFVQHDHAREISIYLSYNDFSTNIFDLRKLQVHWQICWTNPHYFDSLVTMPQFKTVKQAKEWAIDNLNQSMLLSELYDI